MRRPNKLKVFLLLAAIFLLGAGFRFVNLNWDQNQHLHPDERFLTMVGLKLQLPSHFQEYLNPTGPFSPYGVGETFFVYGMLPLAVTKLAALFTHSNIYDSFTIISRALAALVETATLVTATALAFRLEKKNPFRAAAWTAFLYATAVLPIQLAHFGTTDPWLTFLLTLALALAVRTNRQSRWLLPLGLTGFSWGAALASKLTAVLWLPLLLFFIAKSSKQRAIKIGFFLCVSAITLRLADPHLFATRHFLDFRPNPLFIANIKTLSAWNTPEAHFPPGVQWLATTPFYGFKHNVFWGLGLPLAGAVLAGYFYLARNFRRHRKATPFLIIALFTLAIFIYQSMQFSKALRYFYPLYPLLCLVAGNWLSRQPKAGRLTPLFLIWPVMFLSIYLKPHSRITASEWIYRHVPSGSIIATEYWDDALPLLLENRSFHQYHFESLHLYDQENTSKWSEIRAQLAETDYLIISSNRLTGSIMTVPEQYPQTTDYYLKLFSGQSDFALAAEFHSFPCFPPFGKPLFCLNDQSADESFTVFDHPQVFIFAKRQPLPSAF